MALTSNLVRDGSLPCHDQGIVERMHQDPTLLDRPLVGATLGRGIVVAGQLYRGAESSHRLHLDLWSRSGHHDHGRHPQGPRRERHPLSMIARARTDHATGTFGIRQMGDPVVGTPKLEAENWLEISNQENQRVLE